MKATIDCGKILARLSEEDLEDLEAWKAIENFDSVYLGGRGHAPWQMDAAKIARNSLSREAETAFYDMRDAVVHDLVGAIRDVGIPDTERDIDAIVALLGHDHPAFRILPAFALAEAYMEAIDHVEA